MIYTEGDYWCWAHHVAMNSLTNDYIARAEHKATRTRTTHEETLEQRIGSDGIPILLATQFPV